MDGLEQPALPNPAGGLEQICVLHSQIDYNPYYIMVGTRIPQTANTLHEILDGKLRLRLTVCR